MIVSNGRFVLRACLSSPGKRGEVRLATDLELELKKL